MIQERDGSNVPICAYTRGNDLSVSLEGAGGIGGLLARTRYFAGTPTSSYFYFADGNGNITYMIDTNQTMVASYRYDPFGNIISKSGSLADVNVYRFSSKEIHANSGMYYYGFRFYDPNLQRWLNRDPIEERGGVNLYSFAMNRPVIFYDAYGEDGAAACAAMARGLKIAGIEEVAGGGPEDPLADLVAGATLAAFAGYAAYEYFHNPMSMQGQRSKTGEAAEHLDSIEKAQEKAKKDMEGRSIKDTGSEWEGAKSRLKQNRINRTNKSEQRAKAQDYQDEDEGEECE